MNNYLRLGYSEDGKTAYFVYCDTEQGKGITPISDNLIRIEDMSVMSRPGEKYKMVFVQISAEDEEAFVDAMEKVKGIMLFGGHKDYARRAGNLIGELRAMIQASVDETGWIELPEGGRIRAGALA